MQSKHARSSPALPPSMELATSKIRNTLMTIRNTKPRQHCHSYSAVCRSGSGRENIQARVVFRAPKTKNCRSDRSQEIFFRTSRDPNRHGVKSPWLLRRLLPSHVCTTLGVLGWFALTQDPWSGVKKFNKMNENEPNN